MERAHRSRTHCLRGEKHEDLANQSSSPVGSRFLQVSGKNIATAIFLARCSIAPIFGQKPFWHLALWGVWAGGFRGDLEVYKASTRFRVPRPNPKAVFHRLHRAENESYRVIFSTSFDYANGITFSWSGSACRMGDSSTKPPTQGAVLLPSSVLPTLEHAKVSDRWVNS